MYTVGNNPGTPGQRHAPAGSSRRLNYVTDETNTPSGDAPLGSLPPPQDDPAWVRNLAWAMSTLVIAIAAFHIGQATAKSS